MWLLRGDDLGEEAEAMRGTVSDTHARRDEQPQHGGCAADQERHHTREQPIRRHTRRRWLTRRDIAIAIAIDRTVVVIVRLGSRR